MSDKLPPSARLIGKILAVLRLPWVVIELSGPHAALFRSRFMGAHRHFSWLSKKVWGVALLRLPTTTESYLEGGHRQALRTNRNRSIKLKYQIRSFDPQALRLEIDAIHRAIPKRQGHQMEYNQQEDILQSNQFPHDYLGVFSHDNTLVAVACTPVCGQLAIQLTFIGHPDHLRNGVMYALQTAVVQASIARGAQWLTYEGFFGQSDGMRYFLERCGYAPSNVTWRLGTLT